MSSDVQQSDDVGRRRRRRRTGCALTVLILGAGCAVIYGGGGHQGPGEIVGGALDAGVVLERVHTQRLAAMADGGELPETRILFGDMHVHTTFSADAFMRSLPPVGGEGLHPPADACDFARYCSQIDFFALTDHAEALTPQHWTESQESIRQCNEIAGGGDDPDLVAYMGFEWTQVGATPEEHYGHKNVIFRDLDAEHLPARPIAAPVLGDAFRRPPIARMWLAPLFPILDFPNRERYMDVVTFVREARNVPPCPAGVDTRELPLDCREIANTPAELFAKLDQWGFDSMVIPHGSTWGFYTPPGYTWDKQIDPAQDDPDRQYLVEVYSGHGNSEEYRWYRAVVEGEDGRPGCPRPSEGFEPCCYRAGEIVRRACGDIPEEECERRVSDAERAYVEAGVAGHQTLPGATAEEWGDCGQCTNCFLPSFNYRPGGSVQYMMARAHFDEDGTPRHQRFGFIASSDNHTARPGTGYKEYGRRYMTEATGAIDEAWHARIFGERSPPTEEAVTLTYEDLMKRPPFALVDLERQSSFFLTGGLVAVHATGRDRDSIWEALQARRVYATSGDRILLWFDLLNGPDGAVGMGSETRMGAAPRFRVHAVGALKQQDGCPDWVSSALGPERTYALCMDQCYHPSTERKRITRIEVVRILPQTTPERDVGRDIQTPWRILHCDNLASTCTFEFEDPEFVQNGRTALYYVRAIEEPSPVVNGGNMRCSEDGYCEPCYGDHRVDASDDCLAEAEERAWSSPIWVDFDASQVVPEATADAGVDGPADAGRGD